MVIIPHPKNNKPLGVKMSGGVDSSILLYALAKEFDNPLVPITVDNYINPYQSTYTNKVIDFVNNELNVSIPHTITDISSPEVDLDDALTSLVQREVNKGTFDVYYMAQTKNPDPKLVDEDHLHVIEDTFHRLPERDWGTPEEKLITGISYRPFINLHKGHIKELYDYYGVTDTLFPLTKSCETDGTPFTEHCGHCWWCVERHWAFNKL